ncbi:proton channel OtopLc-like [Hydractinia symbiolongicarpus]|uniref:proton channel OtopLc-like n=1 Tax=Hydractinia symbiolongicarpus TaxID=13093 RepID=UPI0025510CB5|nr:proton channel OtopLc-like [Hydractinia symbiolongicarpus]
MKHSEVLTIEKLKLGMENENKHETTNTAELLRNGRRQTATNRRAPNSNRFFLFLMYILEPILPSDGTRSDGRIASVVYLICLTTAGIVMNMTAWLQNDSKVAGITTDHIDGFLITCICPALIWIMYIFCKQNDRKTVDFISSLPHSHRPLMAGAYVFGAGSSVMDILHISFYLQCSRNISSLFFSLFKAIFILTQILFLRKFANATLHKSQNIRLVLFHILGTNICLWFRALFSHARLLFKSVSLEGPRRSWCSAEDVPMSKIWTASEPYLYPFTMEYSLIAGGMLYTMWSGMRDLDPDPQDIYIYDEMQDEEDKEEKAKNFLDDSSGYIGSVASPTLSRSHSHISLYSRASNHSLCRSCQESQESHEIMDTYKPSADPGFLLGILLSTLLFISIAFLWIDTNSSHALKFYYLYQITLHTIMVICLWLILKGLQSQRSSWYPYNSDDALLIVSFTGVFLYAGLSFTAAVTELNVMQSMSTLLLIKSSLVLIESMLQVTAIVKALRFRPSFKGTQGDIVRQGALFLLTTNLALWGQDSFFELRNMATTPIQVMLYGSTTWRAVTIFAYPLCIFFRFHAGACLFEVWSTFKQY